MKLTEEQIQSNLKAYEHAMSGGDFDTIEYYSSSGGRWHPKQGSNFDYQTPYRLKPTPKLRAFKEDELPLDAWYREKGSETAFKPTGTRVYGVVRYVCLSGAWESTEELFKTHEQSADCKTWFPCARVEEVQ